MWYYTNRYNTSTELIRGQNNNKMEIKKKAILAHFMISAECLTFSDDRETKLNIRKDFYSLKVHSVLSEDPYSNIRGCDIIHMYLIS